MCSDVMQKRWTFPGADEAHIRHLAEQLHISTVLAQVLINRGIDTAEQGRHYLYDSLDASNDAFQMKDMDKAVQRIGRAIEKHECIVIYGDYDVDGITSTALLYLVLQELGAAPSFYIPERQSEGYGLHTEAIQQLVEEGTDLLITVDCGIASYDIVEQFREDVDIIITDHHEPPARVPDAYAVLNPKQDQCAYPFKELAGAGVAYKLCQALWLRQRGEILTAYSEIAALGTIADLVPLQGENRIIVREGLRRIREGCSIGIQALLQAASVAKETIQAGRIAYTIAPRLNAAGRISHARKGVQLLLEADSDRALQIAGELSELNRERQDIERDIAQKAAEQIQKSGHAQDNVLIAYGEGWHPGVIGIAASRLVEQYYRPALVISIHDGIGKGSCRSIRGFNMYEALQYADDLLIQYGGHPMAAGFSIAAEHIEDFRRRLERYANMHMSAEDYIPVLAIDKELQPQEVTLELIDELSQLEPYGMGNSRPVFVLSDCRVTELRPIGRDKQHLRLVVTCGGQERLSGVGWSMAGICDEILEGDRIQAAFQLEKNEFNGLSSPQLVLQDIQLMTADIRLDRTVMVDVYLALKKWLPERGMAVCQVRRRLVAAEGDRYDAHTIYAAVTVLKEIGVLNTGSRAGEPFYYFPVLTGKMELHTSPTYQKYSGA